MPTLTKSVKRPWIPERETQARRIHDNGSFYRSSKWRKLRAKKISINPLCQECERKGLITPANVVDHIKPIIQGGEPLSMSNLQSLCHRCHNIKSGKEAHLR